MVQEKLDVHVSKKETRLRFLQCQGSDQNTARAQHGLWCECQAQRISQEGMIINRNQYLVKLSCNFKMHNPILFLPTLFKCEGELDFPEYHDCASWPSQTHEEFIGNGRVLERMVVMETRVDVINYWLF